MVIRSSSRTLIALLCAVWMVPVFPGAAQDDTLQQCDHPVGTLAVVEPQDHVIQSLKKYQLSSPTSLIRMMVQNSNCFVVVERGMAMQNLMQERELAQSGQLQQGENVGGGQMKAADFILTPEVIFSEGNAGGVGGAIGGVLGRRNRRVAAIAGGLKFKEAHTSIIISDTRSGVQVAAADGQARKTDFRLGMLRYGGGSAAAAGGYTNTNEGKVIAASFLDNYNNVVASVRGNPSLQARRADVGGSEVAEAGAVFSVGDVLLPKIDNVPLLSGPAESAGSIGSVSKSDEFVFLGEEKDGFIHVQGSARSGWVRKALMAKM